MENKYFKRTAIFILSACTIILLTNCSKKDKNGLTSSDYLLVGDQISKHDQDAGVIQVSPGTKDNPISEGMFDIPESKSLLRFKLFDDPIENPETNGLVKLVLLTSKLDSALTGSVIRNKKFDKDEITIELNVKKISVLKKKSPPPKRFKDRIINFYPTTSDSKIYFNQSRSYTMAVKGISLPEGDYRFLTVHFKREGKLYYKGEIYPIRLAKKTITYLKKFSVEKGRITTLSLISIKDKIEDIIKKHFNFKKKYIVCRSHHWYLFKKRKSFIPLTLRLFIPYDETIHNPVSQIFVRFSQLSAVNSNGDIIILNDQETEFELLSLRSGAVALMGSNAVDAGEYKYFELELGTDHHVIANGESYPLTIEDWSYDTLRFMGTFELRGGRITEVFLHFDPNKSLFYIRGQGFIMEPDIMITSTISMTPVQEFRLVESLGQYSNVVMSQTELAFQGNVLSVTPVLADNMHGKKMIYSDVTMNVEDRLRGVLDNPSQYILRVIGGSHNGINLKVAGMPEFCTGEKVLLFLKNYNGRMSTIHGDYGKIILE